MRLKIQNEFGESQLTSGLMVRMLDVIQCATDEPMLVLSGQPDVFCDGLDLDELSRAIQNSPDEALHLFQQYAALIDALQCAPCPVIALVSGRVMGGGFGIAAAADLVIAAANTVFSLPETMLGLIPAVASGPIARRIGLARTRLLALGITHYSAEQAFAAGLVDDITDDLERQLERYTQRLIRMSPEAIRAAKQLLCQRTESTSAALPLLANLLSADSTRQRIVRFVDGESPWDEK